MIDDFQPLSSAANATSSRRYLLGQFAAGSGKKAGEFYTPQRISDILSAIVTLDSHEPNTGPRKRLESVFDFACGSGSLLLNVRRHVTDHAEGSMVVDYAMSELEQAGIKAQPIHDAVVVPVSRADEAYAILRSVCEWHLGFEPKISIKMNKVVEASERLRETTAVEKEAEGKAVGLLT